MKEEKKTIKSLIEEEKKEEGKEEEEIKDDSLLKPQPVVQKETTLLTEDMAEIHGEEIHMPLFFEDEALNSATRRINISGKNISSPRSKFSVQNQLKIKICDEWN